VRGRGNGVTYIANPSASRRISARDEISVHVTIQLGTDVDQLRPLQVTYRKRG
jgi:hypothetical protein